MKVEVENKIWIKSKIVITFFSKKKYWYFQKKGFATILQKSVEKTFFSSVFIFPVHLKDSCKLL